MGNSAVELGQLIFGKDKATCEFLENWNNESLSITAHTSGSTGKPKLIELPKSDMLVSAQATCKFFGINKSSTLVLPLSVNYIAGKMMVVRSIVSGATLWIEPPSNRPLIRDYGMIDLLPIVPSQANWFYENPQLFKSVKNIIVGGGALTPEQEGRFHNQPCNVYASYGMTETCSHVALRNISAKEVCYTALPEISFETDSRECLVIVAPKYSFKRLVTNDIVELVNPKQFIWKGRYDNVINTGGIKVFPEEIEKQLSSLIDVPFYIIGRPSAQWGEEVVLYIESSPIDTTEIIKKARNILNPYCVPKAVIVKSQFYRTESGKIKRILF